MAFHILHVLQHGAFLAKDRGFLVCRPPEGGESPERKMPLEDIRVVVIAARGVGLSSSAISALLGQDAMILHCNERYEPCGITAPVTRIVDTVTFLNQSTRPARLNNRIWDRLLIAKTENQSAVLRSLDLSSAYLERALKTGRIDEGNCARHYWQLYFPAIGWSRTSRDRRSDSPPNKMLNYGYAVLSALCHRALIIHGLSPLLGVGHRARFRSVPLVYDVMEPYRPFVDRMLATFLERSDPSPEMWARHVGSALREERVHHERYSLKLLDALDKTSASIANCYRSLTASPLWTPGIAT